jgi:hypothetical protein
MASHPFLSRIGQTRHSHMHTFSTLGRPRSATLSGWVGRHREAAVFGAVAGASSNAAANAAATADAAASAMSSAVAAVM